MKKRTRNDEAARIRELFLSSRETYSPRAAARLANVDPEQLTQQIDQGYLEARKLYELNRRTVLRLALEGWTLERVVEALGSDANGLLPPLLHLERVELSLPRYTVRVLEYAARRQGVTPAEMLRRILHDYAATFSATDLEEEFPGVAEALFYPSEPPERRREVP